MHSVVERLDQLAPDQISREEGAGRGSRNVQGQPDALAGFIEPALVSLGDTPSTIASAAPVFVLRDVAREVGTGQNDAEMANRLENNLSLDIIDSGLLQCQDASSLLAMFVQ